MVHCFTNTFFFLFCWVASGRVNVVTAGHYFLCVDPKGQIQWNAVCIWDALCIIFRWIPKLSRLVYHFFCSNSNHIRYADLTAYLASNDLWLHLITMYLGVSFSFRHRLLNHRWLLYVCNFTNTFQYIITWLHWFGMKHW